MIKHSFKSCALGGAALAALAAASSAQAQAADAAADEVVVTGSRIIKDGFAQPTPVTVVTMEQMQATAPNSLSDAINQLPQFKSSFISASTGFRNGAGDGPNDWHYPALSLLNKLLEIPLPPTRKPTSKAPALPKEATHD